MEKSKVYFTDFRTRLGEGLPSKLKRLMKAAGIQNIDMDHKFVAIKLHFGELGNLGFLRPNYAKAVADVVKELGGVPFLTDCNTLYPGNRKNAIEHMYCAWENGFTPLTVGCPVIIGDGLKGTDDIEVPVKGGEYVKNAKIGRAIMDADVFISLNHFKGHETAGFGGRCIGACNFDAIHSGDAAATKDFNCRMAEYAKAVVDGRPNFHISLVVDVSPNCDCHFENDAPILPNIGMFASFDPLALDQACVDACLKQTPLPNSQLTDAMAKEGFCDHHDHFENTTPNAEYKTCLEHAEKIGIGSRDYELITIS